MASEAGQEFPKVLLYLKMLIMGMNDFWETNLFHKNLIKKVSQDLSGFLIISGAQET